MASKNDTPQTLLEVIRHFADLDVATAYFAELRWPDGFACPACGKREHSYLTTRRLWKCKACKKQTSVKKGSIFEDSPIGLDRWLPALWLVANCKNGVSSCEVARDLGVTQKTAWFMLQRIRLAMQSGTFEKYSEKFDGVVEVDETYIGGKARNKHANRRKSAGRFAGKVGVMGFYERGGEIRLTVISGTKKPLLHKQVRSYVKPDAEVVTDALASYQGLDAHYVHKVVDHAEKYVDGLVHTNGLENFWSLLKRSLGGTYVSVQPYHLFRYLDEQAYRFNARGGNDGDRFEEILGRATGRRVTWAELTDKSEKRELSTPRPVARFPMGPF